MEIINLGIFFPSRRDEDCTLERGVSHLQQQQQQQQEEEASL